MFLSPDHPSFLQPVRLGDRLAAPRLLRPAAVLLAFVVAVAPLRVQAAPASGPSGAQLLQAQLPNGTPLPQADCEQLIRAVSLATRAHRADAPAILNAALTRGARKDARRVEPNLPCACVSRMLHVAISAAPDKAATLLEVASSLYPDCADSLEAAVQVYEHKNVVDGKNGPAAGQAPAGARTASNDPGANADNASLNQNSPDLFDPALETSGFGVGFGPGFPGSPGFTGSSPSGAIALPPGLTPVTVDSNG